MFGILTIKNWPPCRRGSLRFPDSAVPEIATPKATQDHGLDERVTRRHGDENRKPPRETDCGLRLVVTGPAIA